MQAWTGPQGSWMLRLPEFLDNRHMNVVTLSALLTGRLYPQKISLILISIKRLSRPQGHSAAEKIVNENSQRPHRESHS